MEIGRRRLLQGSAIGAAGIVSGIALGGDFLDGGASPDSAESDKPRVYRGAHQSGVTDPAPRHVSVAAFDVTARDRDSVKDLLRDWTMLGEALTQGAAVPDDTGESDGLTADSLTVTFGFSATFFDDRCAPASNLPAPLTTFPEFDGDELDDAWMGGDLLAQICADDPQVVSHALRQFRRVGTGRAELRWMQDGFVSAPSDGSTPRNLFGQLDGTANPTPGPERDALVWVREDDTPAWLADGTYLVVRRIQMHLLAWDENDVATQSASIGRDRTSGAPLSGGSEFTPMDFDARDSDGSLLVASDAHVRLAQQSGPGMLRRGYNFDRGARPGVPRVDDDRTMSAHDHANHNSADHVHRYDAGLLFLAFVRDPMRQFVPVQRALAASDRLNHFITTTSSQLWVIPPGAPSGSVGDGVFT